MSEEHQKHQDPERLKLICPDKLMMQTIANDFDRWVVKTVESTPGFYTPESTCAFVDLISRMKSAIDCFEKEGEVLK